MKEKNFESSIRWLLILGLISLILGVTRLVTTRADNDSNTKEGPMNLAYKLETKSPEMPPIDTAVTTVFETASFGLG